MLSVHGLDCQRGERTLIRDLSFDLEPQSVLEVRGANGSGKTTLLRALCGLFEPSAGTIKWNGGDIRRTREAYNASVAYLGHANGLKDDLTAAENVGSAARIAGLPASSAEIADALRTFGLEQSMHLPCKVLSQGQRRRAAWARLHLSRTRALWILDEPFSALDTTACGAARGLLEEHISTGGCIVFTTHEDIAIGNRPARRIDL